MGRLRSSAATSAIDLEGALETLSAESLRTVVQEMLRELDDAARARVAGSLIEKAARAGSDWAPTTVTDAEVAEVIAFAAAAVRAGAAEPSEVDECLGRGTAAFLRKDYAAAHRILGAILRPVGDGAIDLGQHELVDEVLGSPVARCASRYLVATYMNAPVAARAQAVEAAIDDMRGVATFWTPLQEMARATLEPLPELEDFLPRWRDAVTRRLARQRAGEWGCVENRWLREVVQRLDGSAGLAAVARASRRADDLRAWCRSLVDAGDWEAACPAYVEAAGLVMDRDYVRGEFLDGAALAAQRLERRDLPSFLEQAWRTAPTFVRLRRWLGSSTSRETLSARVGAALEACPARANRQRALLHLLSRDLPAAATMLTNAPGLGWSGDDHPGALLFSTFARWLGGTSVDALTSPRTLDLDAFLAATSDSDAPSLNTPEVESLLAFAGLEGVADAASRALVWAAMRSAAEARVEAVSAEKRRRHYDHAAVLVAACVACDDSGQGARWASTLRAGYRRFPSLRRAFERALPEA